MLLEGEALPAFFHNEGGDAPGSDAGGGDGKDHIGVGLSAVGDENFLAVEEVVVPHVLGGGLGPAGVGPGVGFRQAEGADFPPRAQVREVFLLLLLVAEGGNGIGAQGGMGGEDDPRAAVHPGQFLHGDGIAQSVGPGALVLRAIGQAHQAQFPHLLHRLRGEAVLLVQHEGDGFDLGLRKFPDFCPEVLVGLGGLIQHMCASFSLDDRL